MFKYHSLCYTKVVHISCVIKYNNKILRRAIKKLIIGAIVYFHSNIYLLHKVYNNLVVLVVNILGYLD